MRWLKLFAVDWERGGKTGTWTFASRKTEPLSGGKEQPDAVVIVPVHDSGRLVITKEYRIAIGGYEYGFPAGLIDKGESVEETARRELFEETGLKVKTINFVSPPIYSSPGMTDESCVLVYVTASGKPTNKNTEDMEDIETLLLDKERICDLMLRKGEFVDAKLGAKMWPVLQSFLGRFGG